MNPVRHNGIDYPSQAALARAIGVSDEAVYTALQRGKMHKLGTGYGRPKPCELDGKTYPSRREAAKTLGVCRKTISNWIKKMDATE